MRHACVRVCVCVCVCVCVYVCVRVRARTQRVGCKRCCSVHARQPHTHARVATYAYVRFCVREFCASIQTRARRVGDACVASACMPVRPPRDVRGVYP